MTHDDDVERVAVWPLIHSLLVQFAPRIAEAEAATNHETRIAIINGVSAHIAGKVEEEIDALSALPPRDELLREALSALQPFAAQTRASGPTEERNIRRARAAADKIRAALGGEKP